MKTVLKVKATPGASRTEIKGWCNDRLRVRVQAPPEKGKANKALRCFLAKVLDIAPGQVSVRSGDTSRNKTLSIEGLSETDVVAKLNEHKE
tara:strand:+ start:909 stop:1181 length:273 start_codon:yes stop_codon:yes gene_type:complete